MTAGAVPVRTRLVPHAVALAFGVGLLAALIVRPGLDWWAVLPIVLAAVVVVRVGSARAAVAVLVAAAALVGWWWGGIRLAATATLPTVSTDRVAGVVEALELPVATREGHRLLVRVTRLDGATARVAGVGARVFLVIRGPTPQGLGHGSRLRVDGRLGPAAREGDPGWWRAYLERRGVAGTLRAADVTVVGRRGGIGGLRDRARDALGRAAARGLAGDRAAIVRGMALGGGDGLSEPTRADMRAAGLWHLMAVSGQNIAYVSMAVASLLSAVGIRARRAAVLGVAAIVGYCLMCDGGASVARAGVMGALVVMARLLSNPADRWYLLIVALDLLLAVQPRSIFDPGLQLSFTAVVGLLTLAPPLAVWFSGFVPAVVADLAAQAVAASIATAPVTILRFGSLSLAGLVANLIAVPLAAPTVIVAIVGATAGAVVPVLGLAPVWCAGLGADAIRMVAWVAARLPLATIRPGWSGVLVAVAVAGLIVVGRHLLWATNAPPAARSRRVRARHGMPVAVASVTAALVLGAVWHRWHVRVQWPAVPAVTVLDVGQGDAVLFRSPDGRAMLVDTGPPGNPARVVGALRRAGVRRLDLVILTHHQRDHDGALDAVRAAVDVRAVGRAAASPSSASEPGVVLLGSGDRLSVGAWRVEVLWPAPTRRPDDPNTASVVIAARAPGISVLAGGDAEGQVLARVARGPVDVLKVSHHGSSDPALAGVLRVVRPRVAVVSVGTGNPYGHPAAATVGTLYDAGASVWRTDRDGAVDVRPADAHGLAVSAER